MPKHVWLIVFNNSWWRSVEYAGETIRRRGLGYVYVQNDPILILPRHLSFVSQVEHQPPPPPPPNRAMSEMRRD